MELGGSKMSEVQSYNTLEKFMCFANIELIQELVVTDLHENFSILSERNEYQSLLAEYQFESGEANELLNMQIVDSTNNKLGLLGHRQDYLTIIMDRATQEEIYKMCSSEEKHMFYSLVRDYVSVNMEKLEGKHQSKLMVKRIFPHYPSSYSTN